MQSEISRQRVLHEAALECAVGLWHIAVTHGLAQLLAVVVLPSQVSIPAQTITLPRGMAEYLQVVHPLVGQVNITPRTVVVNAREAYFQSVSVGKETALRVTVADAQIGMKPVAGIAHHYAAVALATGSIAQALVLQTDPVTIILYAVCWHAVVGIVDERGTHTVEPVAVASAHLRRQSDLLVVRTSEELHAAAERLRGHVVGVEAQHATDSIAAVE